nr:hypothetical protein OG781_36130 [Streptomyces sp. NBC_00830]
MTSRRPRDLEIERAALRAAADRLPAGTPLRSASGKLTASELLRESGLRRDVAYGGHKDLVEEFQARVKAQHCTPAAMQELALLDLFRPKTDVVRYVPASARRAVGRGLVEPRDSLPGYRWPRA